MKRCFVFSAGSFFGLREKPRAGDLILAADAGFLTCRRLGLVPDLLLGDFDSMEAPDGVPLRRLPVEKDDTDTMAALEEAIRQGCNAVFLYGCTGGKRMDHTLANLQALTFLRHRGVRGYLFDDGFCWTVVENESLTLQRETDWGLVSVFCVGERAEGVTLSGLQYPLRDAVLSADFPLGVSNHFAAETATITVEHGTLLVGWQYAPISG